MNRRDFVLASLALVAPRASSAASGRIDIVPDEQIGVISPHIYGHFTEHLGGCIYDGLWVGENSKVANVGGIRKQVVDHLRLMKASVIRWPGGCFADSYNWRDGVGPRESRPKRTNFWANTPFMEKAPNGPQKFDPNSFGTNEFARLCKLAGAEPYFAANLRSLSPYDFYEWVEYCNSPVGTTSLANLRAQTGDAEPLNIQFWGVGNESWGCGGNFTAAEYAVEYRRFSEWLPRYGRLLSLIASGPNVADYAWTRGFFEKLTEKGRGPLRNLFGLSLHYYCGGANADESTDFNEDGWYKLLSDASFMEELIRNHWQIMGETDKEHAVKLIVDEWGAWHKTDPTIDPSYLFAYFPTMRDALVTGITLDIFNRHSDKVAMANAAQLMNNIHASFLALGDKFTVTPIYHVFRMYAAHQAGTSVRTIFEAPSISRASTKGLAGLSGSCSMHGSSQGVLTVINPDTQKPQDVEISVRGSRLSNVRATVLASTDMHAHNTFDQPRAVEPAEKTVAVSSPFVFQFAPASVTRLDFDLG